MYMFVDFDVTHVIYVPIDVSFPGSINIWVVIMVMIIMITVAAAHIHTPGEKENIIVYRVNNH